VNGRRTPMRARSSVLLPAPRFGAEAVPPGFYRRRGGRNRHGAGRGALTLNVVNRAPWEALGFLWAPPPPPRPVWRRRLGHPCDDFTDS
jgi:hypothetical protein